MSIKIKNFLVNLGIGISAIIVVYCISVILPKHIDDYQYNTYIIPKLHQQPIIEVVDENTFRLTFNSLQNEYSLKWIKNNNYKIKSIAYFGKSSNIPIYLVEKNIKGN